jgi:hypothetical protein
MRMLLVKTQDRAVPVKNLLNVYFTGNCLDLANVFEEIMTKRDGIGVDITG